MRIYFYSAAGLHTSLALEIKNLHNLGVNRITADLFLKFPHSHVLATCLARYGGCGIGSKAHLSERASATVFLDTTPEDNTVDDMNPALP